MDYLLLVLTIKLQAGWLKVAFLVGGGARGGGGGN